MHAIACASKKRLGLLMAIVHGLTECFQILLIVFLFYAVRVFKKMFI